VGVKPFSQRPLRLAACALGDLARRLVVVDARARVRVGPGIEQDPNGDRVVVPAGEVQRRAVVEARALREQLRDRLAGARAIASASTVSPR